jgi:hypothetical protein
MSKILKIRVLTDENDRFVREWEVRTDMTLLDLHDFMCDELKYDNSVISSFYISNEEWDKLQQFTSENVGDDSGEILMMEDIQLGAILQQKGDRLIYVFDPFGDRALYLEVAALTLFDPSVNYPRLIDWRGDAPDQFDASLLKGDSDEDFFEDAFDEFADFEGEDDNYSDEY